MVCHHQYIFSSLLYITLLCLLVCLFWYHLIVGISSLFCTLLILLFSHADNIAFPRTAIGELQYIKYKSTNTSLDWIECVYYVMQQSNPMPSNPSIHTSLHQYSYWWSSWWWWSSSKLKHRKNCQSHLDLLLIIN